MQITEVSLSVTSRYVMFTLILPLSEQAFIFWSCVQSFVNTLKELILNRQPSSLPHLRG